MTTSIRQNIFDAVETKFKTILTANGFRTNAGAHILKWREFATIVPGEMPCIEIGDTKEAVELVGAGKNSSQRRTLTIDYHGLVTGTDTASIMSTIRDIQADIEDAVRADLTWSGLANWTRPKDNQIGFPDKTGADIVGVLTGSLEIVYITNYFNPVQ